MRIVRMNGKKYRIIRYTTNGLAIADFRAVTKKKDYGWKPVRNIAIRKELYDKFYRK